MEESSAAAARSFVRPARFELQLTSTLGLALRARKLDTWVAALVKRQEEPALCMQALQTVGCVHSWRGVLKRSCRIGAMLPACTGAVTPSDLLLNGHGV